MASPASTHQEGGSPSETSTPAVNPAPSPAGFFYLDISDDCYAFKPFSFNRPRQLQDPPSPSSLFHIPNSFIACSSSKGLLLCYESDSNTFHLLNPFINDSTRRIPDPPRFLISSSCSTKLNFLRSDLS
ncbi:uncharacterized protein A4U43_C08F20040 [Asparagus officinalis]|nr:uncharacterized protein A4U43_C08F20040 [Asparagus officinalis]